MILTDRTSLKSHLSKELLFPPKQDILVVLFAFLLLWSVTIIPILVSPLGQYPVIDAEWHNEWAKAVSAGNIFIYAPYFRAPLYPLTLAGVYFLFGTQIVVGSLLSLTFTMASIYLIHLIVYRKSGRIPGIIAASLLCINGVMLFYSSTLLITPMYIFLLLFAYFLLERVNPSVFGWFILGFAAITRPGIVLLFPVFLFLYKKIWKKAWLSFIPIILVWGVNFFHGGPLVLISSQAGINFYIGSGPEADGFTAFATSSHPESIDSLSYPYLDNVWVASNEPFHNQQSPSFVSKWWIAKTFKHIMQNPIQFVQLTGKKILYLISPVAVPSNYNVYYFNRYSPVLHLLAGTPRIPVSGLILWLLVPGALLAGKISINERNTLFWILGLAIGILPFFVTARFRLPIVPFIIILLVSRFYKNLRKSMTYSFLGIGVALFLAALTSSTVLSGGVNMPFYDGIAHYNVGKESEAKQLLLEAVDIALKRNDGIDLNGADALYNIGVICIKRGDVDSANLYFEMAVTRNPAYLSVVNNFLRLAP